MYEKQRTMANGLPERERQKEREWEKNDENFVTFKLDMRVRVCRDLFFKIGWNG